MGALPRSPHRDDVDVDVDVDTGHPPPRRPFTLAAERDQRGIALPSPVVLLTIVAVAMAAVAFVVTRDTGSAEREITPVAEDTAPSPSDEPTRERRTPDPTPTTPPVVRGDVFVEVYNNSGITGLADSVGSTATGAGWKVVGTDNWYGTIPSNTVYYPARLEEAAKLLALDLGVDRTAPAVDPMREDRLTVILTGSIT